MGCIFSSNAAANEKAPPVTSNRTLPSTSSAPRSTAADDSYSQSLVNPIQQNHPALASGTPRDRSTSGALSPRNSAANATSPLPNNNLQQHRSTTRVHRRSLASGTPRGSASNNPRDPSAASVRQRAASSVHRSSAANAPRDRLAANTFRYSVAVSSESSDQIATSRLSSLLSIVTTQLRSSSTASSDDTETLRLMRPVLNLLDDAFTRGLNSIRDVELLQDFILNARAVLIIRFIILKISFSRHSAMVV
ncbi:hypothetical protein F5887DRAFT_380887 [Amanita rubescens]|nr:hypothetical protein F5887DRAFT_380887 [Amanita rubescens]